MFYALSLPWDIQYFPRWEGSIGHDLKIFFWEYYCRHRCLKRVQTCSDACLEIVDQTMLPTHILCQIFLQIWICIHSCCSTKVIAAVSAFKCSSFCCRREMTGIINVWFKCSALLLRLHKWPVQMDKIETKIVVTFHWWRREHCGYPTVSNLFRFQQLILYWKR